MTGCTSWRTARPSVERDHSNPFSCAWRFIVKKMKSGRCGRWPAHTPLRTVRESFPSYGSSPHKAGLCSKAGPQAKQRRSRHQAAWQYSSVVVTRCASFGNSTQDVSTDGCRSSFAVLVSNGSPDFPAISDQNDVGISSALHTGVGFFGPPNAAAPDPPCGEVCSARTGRAGSVSMFHNNPK